MKQDVPHCSFTVGVNPIFLEAAINSERYFYTSASICQLIKIDKKISVVV